MLVLTLPEQTEALEVPWAIQLHSAALCSSLLLLETKPEKAKPETPSAPPV